MSHLHSARNDKGLFLTSTVENNFVEIKFREGYGLSLLDHSLFDVLGFKGVPDTNWGGFFIGCNEKVVKQHQPVISNYPPDKTAGTDIFLVSSDIIEHQHIAGIKAPFLRLVDTEGKLSDGELAITSSTIHKVFTELQFRKLVRETVREIFIELVDITGHYVFFVGTSRVLVTLKFEKISNARLVVVSRGAATFFRAHPSKRQWILIVSSRSWPRGFALRKKVILPAVKSIGRKLFMQSLPDIIDVATKKKSPIRALKWAVKKLLRNNSGLA